MQAGGGGCYHGGTSSHRRRNIACLHQPADSVFGSFSILANAGGAMRKGSAISRALHITRQLRKKQDDDDVSIEVEQSMDVQESVVDAKEPKDQEGSADAKAGRAAKSSAEGGETSSEKAKLSNDEIKEKIKQSFATKGELDDDDIDLLAPLEWKEIFDILGDEGGKEPVFFEPGTVSYEIQYEDDEGNLIDPDDGTPREVMKKTYEEEETRPRLAQESKDMIFKLHSENPQKYTFKELGIKFGIAPERAAAIVRRKFHACMSSMKRIKKLATPLDVAVKETIGRLSLHMHPNTTSY
jgi:hypothetical protein